MRYKSENKFCIDTTKKIVGLVHYGQELLCVPEVPKGFFSNEHTDMLIIDKASRKMFAIEYKLKDISGLMTQVETNQKVRTIGIINKDVGPEAIKRGVYGFTGQDYQIELLHEIMIYDGNIISLAPWTSIYDSSWARLYWYAFKDEETSFNGGLKNSGRPTFHHFYMNAIKNLQADYDNKLDFLIVNSVFNVGYSESTARKYYKKVMKEINGDQNDISKAKA